MSTRTKAKAAPPETAAQVPRMRIARTPPSDEVIPASAAKPPPARTRQRRRKFVF